MIKAIATDPSGRKILIIGLSYGNLNRFKKEPRETYIKIDGTEMDLPIDVMIFSGVNESDLAGFMKQFLTSETKIHEDPTLGT